VRSFSCDSCGQLVFFANSECLRCRSPLGYLHERRDVISLTEIEPGRMVDTSDPTRTWQYCSTHPATGCNWLVPSSAPGLCQSCELTRTRPADGDRDGLAEFVAAENAKRRLIFQLAELGLPIRRRDEATEQGVVFDLLASNDVKVITGHDDGVITLDLAEADDEHREHLRLQLNEPYRTLLGHFRHEIGHYYWPVLVSGDNLLSACRALFGDDTQDYAEAVKGHYSSPSHAEAWGDEYISHYATMHPYEDWAETFAHYLHILDTLQTAENFGVSPPRPSRRRLASQADPDPTRPDGRATFGEVIDYWLELSCGLNQINQSMGRDDLYPFVLAPPVIRKLAFIDRVVRLHRAAP